MIDWKERFASLGLRPSGAGLRGRFEDINIFVVQHPFKGLCIMGNQFDGRHGCEVEEFISIDSDVQAIAAAFVRIHDLVQPKSKPVMPSKPARSRPPTEEALGQVPDLIRQLNSTLDELGFLFQRHLMLDGDLDQKIGEIIAAYVYDLELTRDHRDFSEANTADGRNVQVRITRARSSRRMVALKDACEHLLVVRLWGREIIEIYNGPLGPIWTAAKHVRKDGSRRISMGQLRGHNPDGLLGNEKLQQKRVWTLENDYKQR